MKKIYTYVIWLFAFIIFFLTLNVINEFSQAWNEAYLARLEEEKFYRSRISLDREEEIKKIVDKANKKRLTGLLRNKMKSELQEEGKDSIAHVNELKGKFPDIRGRIIVDGTEIDFPVVQGTDNDFYLDHDYDGSYYINGGVFIDYVHSGDFSDQNTVVYGHNVRIGYIFHDLDKFRDKDFAKKHSQIIIDTPIERRTFEVVCAMDVHVDADYRFYEYDDDEFEDYLNLIRESNILEGKPLPKKDDKILTLSTCSDLNDRFAVVAIETTNKLTEKKGYASRKNKLLNDRRMTTETLVY